MSTLDGPLGAPPGGTRLQLRRPTLTGTPPVGATAVGQFGLAAVLFSALLLSFAAARTNVLLPESTQPVTGLPLAGPLAHLSFHLQSGEVIGALVLMFAGYVITVRHAESLSPRLVIAVIGVFLVAVLLAPPLFSTDVFSYQEYARMYFHLRVNPYTNSAGVLDGSPPDGIYGYISSTWVATPTVYGPLFTLLSGLFQNTSTPADIALSAYAYKVIAAISCAAVCWMLWRMARSRGVSPVRAVALFGLNPLIVLYGVGGGHNDLLMMLFATAGIWAMLARRPASGGALVITSAAVKLTGALFLPFALAAGSPGTVAGSHDSTAEATGASAGTTSASWRRRLGFGAALAIIVWTSVGLAIWGHGLTNMIHTLRQVQSVGGWQNVPGFFSTVLGWQQISNVISTLFGICFALISCRLLWRVYRHDLDWLHAAGWATFTLLIATSSIQPWYICWLVVPLALCASRRMWVATAWLTGWLQLTVIMGYLPHAPNILGI